MPPVRPSAAIVVHELVGPSIVDQQAPVGAALGGRDVAIIVDGEEDGISEMEFEWVHGFGEGNRVGAVGETKGDGGRNREDGIGWGEADEEERDEAVVDVVGTAEDVEVGPPKDDVANS